MSEATSGNGEAGSGTAGSSASADASAEKRPVYNRILLKLSGEALLGTRQ